MQELITTAQNWLPEEAVKILVMIGVIVGSAIYAIRAFRAGERKGASVPSTLESDLRQGIANLSAENRQLHSATHEKLDDYEDRLAKLELQGAVLLDRTAR